MKNNPYLYLSIVFILLSFSVVYGHPSLTTHTNNSANIHWEDDGIEDGSSAHNHSSSNDFNGWGSTAEPFSAYQCWDNHTRRLDTNGDFDNGHCFIDEGTQSNIVTYLFVGGDNVWKYLNPNGGNNGGAAYSAEIARPIIKKAFDTFGNVLSDTVDNVVGIEFVEITTGTADINIVWEDQGGANGGGFYSTTNSAIHFDSSVLWYWNEDPKIGINDPFGMDHAYINHWHFHSVALHEVGHAVGLFHQTDSSDLMTPSVGEPFSVSGHRYFMGLDPDTIAAVRALYSQPNSPPSSAPNVGNIGTWFYWTSIFNSTFYEIHRSSSVNGSYSFYTQTPATSLIFPSGYYYKIRGCNSLGCGSFSIPRQSN